MSHSLRNQTVLVTGGGSGIGRLLALGAAERGARVIVWDLSDEAGRKVSREIVAAGHSAEAYTVDVSDRDSVQAAAKLTGPVDVLINNAGIVTGKNLLDASDEAIERTIRVNTLSLFWVTRAFLGNMIENRRGTVVTVSSAAGLVGVAKQTDYSASKFAAFGFAESLRVELSKANAGVNSLVVCPYFVSTGMFKGVQTKYPLLLPILTPEFVAEKTLTAIEKGRQELIMPRFVNLLSPARVLPVRWFDKLMNQLGVNNTMDHFVGRVEAKNKN
ncbi:SDR family NAD(P)-dependent oxidoreductase [Rhodococcus sp. PAMC28707]|uniref:SDR family oxidoreductase n=1 Tax=unclassified Rhodococcus (in: high G+C Gram-positive bacteria) TaxID=192944 RepID=UPI00109D882F|nr:MULTISPECIES: SDR family oxidoreductase [unclassified Rhodococcus (in: high G+C Gram-positive bacteria)]QCB49638.1 SDR family NAD(P)-dependent oxidoreductase [Rhodococcus sp. PAMC28705]QCB58671.1 SDR family NAD(P)-dependent oxidoreductase [Rhodococcus sp. PAMC28707]